MSWFCGEETESRLHRQQFNFFSRIRVTRVICTNRPLRNPAFPRYRSGDDRLSLSPIAPAMKSRINPFAVRATEKEMSSATTVEKNMSPSSWLDRRSRSVRRFAVRRAQSGSREGMEWNGMPAACELHSWHGLSTVPTSNRAPSDSFTQTSFLLLYVSCTLIKILYNYSRDGAWCAGCFESQAKYLLSWRGR